MVLAIDVNYFIVGYYDILIVFSQYIFVDVTYQFKHVWTMLNLLFGVCNIQYKRQKTEISRTTQTVTTTTTQLLNKIVLLNFREA